MTKILTLFSLLALGISCNNLDPGETNVQFEIPSLANREALVSNQFLNEEATAPFAPESIAGFDCVLVNVVGEGIGEWDSNSDKVGVGRNFSYIGSVSKMVSAKTGGTVDLKIKKGSLRYIQLIGVRSTVGCPANITAADLNSFTKFPGMFIIGSVQKDIFQNETVSIKSSYSVSSTADFRASPDNPRPPVDKEAPTPATGKTDQVRVTSSGLDTTVVSWDAAKDNATLPQHLKYRLVTSTTSESIDDITEIIAMNSNDDRVLVDWTSNTFSKTVNGLNPASTYYFAVAVKDASGNYMLYSRGSQAPTCACSAGTYLNAAGGCTSAEEGFWASSCTKTACSNSKPANSSFSTGSTTSTCSWTCDSGYTTSADGTSCVYIGNANPVGCTGVEAVVGFVVRHGALIDKLGIICQNYNAGKPTGSDRYATAVGGEGGVLEEFHCPSGEAVYALEYKNTGTDAEGIRFKCIDAKTNTPSNWSKWYGGTSNSTNSITCESGKVLNWMAITPTASYVGPISEQFGCL